MELKTRLLILKSDLPPEVKDKLLYQQPVTKFGKCKDCGGQCSAVSQRCRECTNAQKRLPNTEKVADIVNKIESGMTLQQVGDNYGVSRERIRQIYKKKTGLATNETRLIQREIEWGTGNCIFCGKTFMKSRKDEILCSPECREEYHQYKYFDLSVCSQCGLGYMNNKSRNRQHKKFCGRFCQGMWLAQNHGVGNSITKVLLNLAAKQRQSEAQDRFKNDIELLEVMEAPFDLDTISKVLGVENPNNWAIQAIKYGLLRKKYLPHGKKKFAYEIIKETADQNHNA